MEWHSSIKSKEENKGKVHGQLEWIMAGNNAWNKKRIQDEPWYCVAKDVELTQELNLWEKGKEKWRAIQNFVGGSVVQILVNF